MPLRTSLSSLVVVATAIFGVSNSFAQTNPLSPADSRFLETTCGSVVDMQTQTEWAVGQAPSIDPDQLYSWPYSLESCDGGWNIPTPTELATLIERSGPNMRAMGLPAAFSSLTGVPQQASVWTDSSVVWTDSSASMMDEDTQLARYQVAFNFGTGRAVAVLSSQNRPARAFASRPYFTDADWRASPLVFSDFPAQRYSGRAAPIRLASEQERMMRTRLREIATGPTNFAGEYGFGCWGAGAGYVTCAAVSKRTGRVVWLGGVLNNHYPYDDSYEPVTVQNDSRLVVMRGMFNGRYPVADHYYEIRDGSFHLLRRIPKWSDDL